MVVQRLSITDEKEFYNTFKELNPAIVLGLIIISFGFYIVYWMYSQNKEIEKIDDEAPELSRCAFILFGFPFFWFVLSNLIKIVFFSNSDVVPQGMLIADVSIWALIILLVLKYIFDFCKSFAKVTKSNQFIWFTLISFGIIGIVGISIQSFFLTPFAFFLAMTIPAMQEELNHIYHKSEMKKKSDTYYSA